MLEKVRPVDRVVLERVPHEMRTIRLTGFDHDLQLEESKGGTHWKLIGAIAVDLTCVDLRVAARTFAKAADSHTQIDLPEGLVLKPGVIAPETVFRKIIMRLRSASHDPPQFSQPRCEVSVSKQWHERFAPQRIARLAALLSPEELDCLGQLVDFVEERLNVDRRLMDNPSLRAGLDLIAEISSKAPGSSNFLRGGGQVGVSLPTD